MKWLALPLMLALATWTAFLAERAPGTTAARDGFPLDDAWIHLVYARALVEEGGFHYNTGEPEAGMTSPLWVLLLAAMIGVTGGAGKVGATVLGAKALSLLFGLATVVMVYLLAREVSESRFTGILAATLTACDPSLIFARASGMEIQLFSALLVLALWLSLRGRWVATGAVAGLSIVARPEGVVMLPVYGLVYALARSRGRAGRRERAAGDRAAGMSWRRGVLAAALAAIPAAAYSLFCLRATGKPLPNTYYAKFVAQSPLDPSLLFFGWKHYVYDNLPWFTLGSGLVLGILGCVRLVRRGGLRAALVLGSGLVLFVAAMTSRTYAPGHYFYWERWIMPCFPFLHLAIASGVEEVRRGLPVLRPRRGETGLAWTAAAGVLLLLLSVRLPGAIRERAEQFAWNSQNIEEMNVALGRWVDSNLPPDAVIAVNDAGALRYFGRRRTIDLIGLNNHRVLTQDPSLGDRPFDTFGVGYLVIFPAIFTELVERLPMTAIHGARSAHYTICEAPQDVMVVYQLGRNP